MNGGRSGARNGGADDDDDKGLLWKLPAVRSKELGRLGSAFGVGACCGVGFGLGLMVDFKMNGRMGGRGYKEPMLTQMVTSVFKFVWVAEFEILCFLFFFIAFLIFKDLTSRPEYNQILVKKAGGIDLWPY